jgi:hypothetical protein
LTGGGDYDSRCPQRQQDPHRPFTESRGVVVEDGCESRAVKGDSLHHRTTIDLVRYELLDHHHRPAAAGTRP